MGRLAFLFAAACLCLHAQVTATSNGFIFHRGSETLTVEACGPRMLHIVASPADASASSPHQPWLVHGCVVAPASFKQTGNEAVLSTTALRVVLTLDNGNLSFRDNADRILLNEGVYGAPARTYEPRTDLPDGPAWRVTDRFWPQPTESFYGLGQHQGGMLNYRGSVIDLAQQNTDVAVPFLLSSRGYGIMWNTASHSWFDDRFATKLKLTAEAVNAIDYYFFYGPELDDVIHQYRDLTGHAPLLPLWAYGFIQSKDRYRSAADLLNVAAQYRERKIPLDAVVQDWQWWTHQGDPDFSSDYLKPNPDVARALETLHAENVHAMISIWGVTDPKSHLFQQLSARHLIIPNSPDYDPTSKEAGDLYWNWLPRKLMEQGWDAFWLDASEPEEQGGNSDGVLDHLQLSIGAGARYTNIFPLMHTGVIYSHWRAENQSKRVVTLTRSAFLGQQRNAAITWSGDIFSTFSSLRRQVAAGLNFSISGIPYWTTDIGGYAEPERDTRDPAYQELYTRWFEYGAFCPIFRTHGWRANETNEIYSYGDVAPILIRYDKLRHQFLPYIYSLAHRVTADDYTMMRPLVMDWRQDERVVDIGDQFMFGPALLVNPILNAGARSRQLYLPDAKWYDFWTNSVIDGKQYINAAAPLDRIPLYVRAGSIIPMSSGDAIELRVYPGVDGTFTLYQDAGDGYAYEHGDFSTVQIDWHDGSRQLTIGASKTKLSFHVVLADAPQSSRDVKYTGELLSMNFVR